jgi:hypothetical protein
MGIFYRNRTLAGNISLVVFLAFLVTLTLGVFPGTATAADPVLTLENPMAVQDKDGNWIMDGEDEPVDLGSIKKGKTIDFRIQVLTTETYENVLKQIFLDGKAIGSAVYESAYQTVYGWVYQFIYHWVYASGFGTGTHISELVYDSGENPLSSIDLELEVKPPSSGGGGGGGGVVCSKPYVSTYAPEKDAVNVALNAEVSATFNIDVAAVSSTSLNGITIKCDCGSYVEGISASLNGRKLTIAHDSFDKDRTYTVTIPAKAVRCEDSTSESYQNDLISWSFTTTKDAGSSDVCQFPDVPSTYWAYSVITDLCQKGVVAGYPDGLFRPESCITRAEFAKIIVEALNLTESKPADPTFSDVTSADWYFGYVETAAKAGLVKGFETGEFRPNECITREQISAILVRVIGKESAAIANAGTATIFIDDGDISAWARGSVVIVVQEGLVGYPDHTFKPGSNATRAEACAMIHRFVK